MDFDQTQVIDDFELEEAESEEENKVRSKKIEVSLKKFRRITMHSLSATITFRTFQRHSCWRALFLLVCWFPFVSSFCFLSHRHPGDWENMANQTLSTVEIERNLVHISLFSCFERNSRSPTVRV